MQSEPRRQGLEFGLRATSADSLDLIWRGPLAQSSLAFSGRIAILIVVGFAALCIDVPLSRMAFYERGLSRLHGFLESMEPFGQPMATVITATAILLCSWRLRPGVPRLLACSLGAGLMADLFKLLLSRTRPRAFDWTGGVLATFNGFLPGLGRGSPSQGFPSSHTALAMGFGLALATMFPEGRWLFMAATALVALQRIECGAHFLSDTCWGAAVGFAVAFAMFHPRFLGSWFDRREARRWARAAAEPNATAESPESRLDAQRQAS